MAIQVSKHDVLFGRGARIAQHEGNVEFRRHIYLVMSKYDSLPEPQPERRVLAHEVIDEIESQGGRFLQRTCSNGRYSYRVVDRTEAAIKVIAAIRDRVSRRSQEQKKRARLAAVSKSKSQTQGRVTPEKSPVARVEEPTTNTGSTPNSRLSSDLRTHGHVLPSKVVALGSVTNTHANPSQSLQQVAVAAAPPAQYVLVSCPPSLPGTNSTFLHRYDTGIPPATTYPTQAKPTGVSVNQSLTSLLLRRGLPVAAMTPAVAPTQHVVTPQAQPSSQIYSDPKLCHQQLATQSLFQQSAAAQQVNALSAILAAAADSQKRSGGLPTTTPSAAAPYSYPIVVHHDDRLQQQAQAVALPNPRYVVVPPSGNYPLSGR